MKINRQQVYEKCDGHCGYCGKKITPEQMQVDHIRPKHWFYHGTTNVLASTEDRFIVPDYDVDDLRNLMPSCARCNRWKSTYSVDIFRGEIQQQLRRLKECSANYRMALDYGLVEEKENQVKFYFEK